MLNPSDSEKVPMLKPADGTREIPFRLFGQVPICRRDRYYTNILPLSFHGPTKMLHNHSIICFGGEDWWYHHPHSKNHLMRRFARAGNRVVFVNLQALRPRAMKIYNGVR
jgi:hypothetical protein